MIASDPLLRSFEIRLPDREEADRFPFSIPALRNAGTVELARDVTFLVGENGSGKSTLLEAIALAAGLPTVGSTAVSSDPTLAAQGRLARALRLTWSRRTRRGFFLRAEDFFGWIRAQRALRQELERDLAETRRRLSDASDYARRLAEGPALASLADMDRRYGRNPDAASHGESFLSLFRSRFVADGLHLLDEPEAALSPQSQLGLVALLEGMVEEGAQFVIATHSPILLAIPGARILDFDRAPLASASWDDLESVRLYREVLNAPERYFRHLWSRPGNISPPR
ncbi:MAG: AAA family ATPase [Gemmatimonadota bacterium]|jgi:predicted ATPase